METDPLPPRTRQLHRDWAVSEWDRLECRAPLSFAQLLAQIQETHHLEIQGLSYGTETLWSLYSPPEDEAAFLESDVQTLLQERFPALRTRRSACLAVVGDVDPEGDCEDVDEDMDIPDIWIRFK
jgi:hypothetical protein